MSAFSVFCNRSARKAEVLLDVFGFCSRSRACLAAQRSLLKASSSRQHFAPKKLQTPSSQCLQQEPNKAQACLLFETRDNLVHRGKNTTNPASTPVDLSRPTQSNSQHRVASLASARGSGSATSAARKERRREDTRKLVEGRSKVRCMLTTLPERWRHLLPVRPVYDTCLVHVKASPCGALCC